MIFLSSSESGRAGLGEEGWFLRGMGMTSALRSRAHRLTTPPNMASSFTNGKRPGVRLKQKKRPQDAGHRGRFFWLSAARALQEIDGLELPLLQGQIEEPAEIDA